MRTYKVNATAHLYVHTTVQANSKKEAIAKAKKIGEWENGYGIEVRGGEASIADIEAEVTGD